MTSVRDVSELAAATLDAERGRATCRICKREGPFGDFITLLYGGGVLFCLCLACAEKGEEVLVRRGPLGIEVLRARGGGPIVKPPLINLASGLLRRKS